MVSSHGLSDTVRSVTQIESMPPASARSTAGHSTSGGAAGGKDQARSSGIPDGSVVVMAVPSRGSPHHPRDGSRES